MLTNSRTEREGKNDLEQRLLVFHELIQLIALMAMVVDKRKWTIGEKLDLDYRTCQKIYGQAVAHGSPSNRWWSGRPVIFNEAEKQRL